MKKTVVLVVVVVLTFLVSALAMAGQGPNWKPVIETKAGTLFLFQKCDVSLVEEAPDAYDAFGCPTGEDLGPWPILPTGRWGQMKYNLLGDKFRFSFEGKKLLPKTGYTLIYYPDPWPGENLICLGTRMSSGAGNLQINGSVPILNSAGEPSGLPTSDDANFSAVAPSGAVGAKIWLVPSADVQCGAEAIDGTEAVPSKMIGWTPEDYLFEGNLIVYQYQEPRDCCPDK